MGTESQFEVKIESLAEQVARELLEAAPALKTAQLTERNALIALALHAGQGSAARLVAAFSRDSSFGDLRNGWIQCGGSGMKVQAHMFPHFLISSIMDGHSAKRLVEEARAFADSRTSAAELYAPLAGAAVSDTLSLSNDIDLIPWAHVPDGFHKILFQPDLSPSIAHMRAMPNSAFRARGTEHQVLFSSYEDAEAAMKVLHDEIQTMYEIIRDIIRCITALSIRPLAAIGSWTQFNQPIATGVYAAPYSYTEALFDNTLCTASFNPAPLDGEALVRLFKSLETFKTSEKLVMRIALDRLNQTLRRQNNADAAIDLGIALEVMLLHDLRDNHQGELKYRSSIRGAMFLGGTNPNRRKTIFELLKEAYDLRSRAVHSGVFKGSKKGPQPEQTLRRATGTCARIARKLIERGSFPEWDSEYVVGGQ